MHQSIWVSKPGFVTSLSVHHQPAIKTTTVNWEHELVFIRHSHKIQWIFDPPATFLSIIGPIAETKEEDQSITVLISLWEGAHVVDILISYFDKYGEDRSSSDLLSSVAMLLKGNSRGSLGVGKDSLAITRALLVRTNRGRGRVRLKWNERRFHDWKFWDSLKSVQQQWESNWKGCISGFWQKGSTCDELGLSKHQRFCTWKRKIKGTKLCSENTVGKQCKYRITNQVSKWQTFWWTQAFCVQFPNRKATFPGEAFDMPTQRNMISQLLLPFYL